MDVELIAKTYFSFMVESFSLLNPLRLKRFFSALLNPLHISLITLFLLTIWNCYLTYRIKQTVHVTLPYSYALQSEQF